MLNIVNIKIYPKPNLVRECWVSTIIASVDHGISQLVGER